MNYQLLADEVLLKLLKISDECAFKEIYLRYWQQLYCSALNKINNREVAEDIVQSIFTDLWEKRERHSEDSRLLDNYIRGQQYTSTGDSLFGTMGAYVGKPLAYRNFIPGVDKSEEVDGYRLGKFEIAMGATNRLSNDWPLFRYADILMMKAESLLRTGDAIGAAEIVTQVRQRVFKSNPAKAVVTGAQLMQGSSYDYGLRNYLTSTTEGGADIQYGRFLDELGWEFNQEARRRTDMIRFGMFTKKSWLSHSPNGDYRALYPIPKTEIDKNSNLKQNPGY